MPQTSSPTSSNAGSGSEPDPSMDDILASIRRILDDDEKAAKVSADGVLMLDPSMIVEEPGSAPELSEAERAAAEQEAADKAAAEKAAALVRSLTGGGGAEKPAESEAPALAMPSETVHSDLVIDEPYTPAPSNIPREAPPSATPTLVAPAAAAAAATSVDALMRTLAAERSAAVSRGMVTIEDVVREAIRPLLKLWLDNHLPPLVERLVQAEIERVVGRNAG